MNNKLEISELGNLSIKTNITTTDGCTEWEIHRLGLSDVDVLVRLIKRRHYQNFRGAWLITIPAEYKVFEHDKFDDAVRIALEYIHARDNPLEIDYTF